jgi:hypothetical protein
MVQLILMFSRRGRYFSLATKAISFGVVESTHILTSYKTGGQKTPEACLFVHS